jgi:uncharacterized protein
LRSFLFPDVNVWLAFVYAGHEHHREVFNWFASLEDDDRACLSRFTQISLLRLLTTAVVMGDEAMSQKQAWSVYDGLLKDGRVLLVDEPAELEAAFRSLTQSPHSSPKQWADAYIAAFAQTANMTLVTFDRALKSRLKYAILLRPSSTS